MDGRVKTLHPMVHGGILARRARGRRSRRGGAARHHDDRSRRREPVPVRREPRPTPTRPFDALIEEIDIGGPSLVRAAAKNFQDVLVVVSPDDYPSVLDQLDREGGPTSGFRFALARARLRPHGLLRRGDCGDARGGARLETTASRERATGSPAFRMRALLKVQDLRYGENPASERHLVYRSIRATVSATPPSCRARSCRTTTCSISTRRCASCSSSANRPPR